MIKKLVIIEDEKPNADRLKRLIQTLRPSIEVLQVLESVEDSIDWLTKNESPDLLLMDIRLSDGLSFEILKKINLDCPIIFTTAYDEYAISAFKFNSIDYLLKPVEKEELDNAFMKLESQQKSQTIKSKDFEDLLHYFSPANKTSRERFLLPYKDGFYTLNVNEIAYFYSEMKITRAFSKNNMQHVIPNTLDELQEQLDEKLFFRANRQFILNVASIKEVKNYFNGRLKVYLKQDAISEIIVSREKSTSFKKWLDS